MQVVQRLVVCVRTGLSVYVGSIVSEWVVVCDSLSGMLVVQRPVVCVRTGLSVYAGSTATGGL